MLPATSLVVSETWQVVATLGKDYTKIARFEPFITVMAIAPVFLKARITVLAVNQVPNSFITPGTPKIVSKKIS